jgi:hypothetical protein
LKAGLRLHQVLPPGSESGPVAALQRRTTRPP